MKNFAQCRHCLFITGIIAVLTLGIIVYMAVNVKAQCAPDDLGCISMP